MTHRERFIRSLTGGALDRFYRYEHGPWPSTRDRWIGEGLPPDAEFGMYFAMDPVVRIAINSGYTHSPFHPPFSQEILEETTDHVVVRGTDGVVRKEFRRRRDTSMPQFIRFPVTSRAEWDKVRERLDPAHARARMGDVVRLRQACAQSDVATLLPICGVFGHPRNLLGEEGLSFVLYDDPGLLADILDSWQRMYQALLHELTRVVRVDVLLIWEDMCYRNGPLISPKHFQEFMLAPYRDLIRTARACGIQAVIVDTDGDCLALIPLFLDAGADCLMPFEVQAGMDVVAIAEEYPNLAIMGGLDKRVLARDRDAIRREVDRVLPYFLTRGGFIPTLDHTVPPNVPLSHFRWYLECVRSYEPSGSGGG